MQDSEALDLFERAVSLHPTAAVQLAREQAAVAASRAPRAAGQGGTGGGSNVTVTGVTREDVLTWVGADEGEGVGGGVGEWGKREGIAGSKEEAEEEEREEEGGQEEGIPKEIAGEGTWEAWQQRQQRERRRGGGVSGGGGERGCALCWNKTGALCLTYADISWRMLTYADVC
jgi:hypothetical protein